MQLSAGLRQQETTPKPAFFLFFFFSFKQHVTKSWTVLDKSAIAAYIEVTCNRHTNSAVYLQRVYGA